MVRDADSAQLAKAGFPMKNLGDIGKQKDEDYFDIQEKEYIKKAFTKFKISEKNATDALGGEGLVDISKEVAKLFHAMDGIGTYEGIIYRVLEDNKPRDVVRIQKLFDIIYKNVEGYGTLIESLKDEMSGSELQRALDALDRANREVEKAGGLKAGAFNFVPYPDFNNLIDDPFKTKLSFKEKAASAFGLGETPIRNDSLYASGYRWIANAKYPASVLSQFFGRTKWKISDYKHREQNMDKTMFGSKKSSGKRSFTRADYDNNPRINNFIKGLAREVVPNYISVIDNFRRARIYYKKTPIMSFKVDASNYKVFVKNYEKQNKGKKPTIKEYIDHCLKHEIVKEARRLIFENDNFGNIYSNVFPLNKMLSHISINMNKYVTYINNIGMEGPSMLPATISAIKGIDHFAFFNQKNLLSLGLGSLTTGLSLAGMDKVRVANQNLSVGDILMLTQSADLSIYFLKSVIKYFLRNTEKADFNIQFSKEVADSTSAAIRKVYAITRLIVNSGETIAKVFGADTPGKGIPSAAELDTQFKGMRYLFNLPVTPIAVASWIAGITPTNIQAWITYVVLEATLITIELLEDYGVIDELIELLFGGEINNPLGAPGFNYLAACKIASEEALKSNPIIEKNQKTLGGEYLLPDGREYVGEYHIHRDGSAMAGGDHPKDQPSTILSPNYTRDDIDV